MTAKVPAVYKSEVSKATNALYLSLALMLTIPIVFGYLCITFLVANRPFDALYFGLFFLFLMWLYSGPLITTYIFTQVYKCLQNRDAHHLEVICSSAIRLLNKLPVSKASSTPALLSLLATARLEQGHYKNAEQLFRDALLQAKRFHRGRDERWTPTIVILCNNLAATCLRQNNLVEADLLLEEGFGLLSKSKPRKFEVYSAFLHLAASAVRYELNELAEAEKRAKTALEIIQTASKPAHLGPAVLGIEAQGSLQLALLRARKDDFAKANELCDQIINDCPAPLSTLSLK